MSADGLDISGKWVYGSRRSTKVYRGRDSQQPRFVPALSGQSRLNLEAQLFLLSFLVISLWFSLFSPAKSVFIRHRELWGTSQEASE